MVKKLIISVFIICAFIKILSAQGQLIVYDENGRGMYASWYPGFAHAVRFTPMSYPFVIRAVGIMIGDHGQVQAPFNLMVWEQGIGGPGNILGSLNNVSASDTGWNWFDVSSLNIIINSGDFYAGIYYLNWDSPWIGVDDILPAHYRSWAYNADSSKWFQITWDNDFEIRAADYLISVEESDTIKLVFENYYLFQCFPNPVFSSTVIRYALPERSNVELKVYDTSGREIVTLLDKVQNAGNYKVTWNIRAVSKDDLPNGVYFYRLKAENFTETKKMVVVR